MTVRDMDAKDSSGKKALDLAIVTDQKYVDDRKAFYPELSKSHEPSGELDEMARPSRVT